MLTIAYYFLQVVLCSGMMMGYYWLVLRNKRFHQYNRFYLLAAALLSWIVPLIKITWSQPVIASEQPQVIQFLSVVAYNNSQIEETIQTQPVSVWSRDLLATGIYFGVAAILFFGMVRAFTKLYRLLRDHSCKNVGDVYLVLTQAKGTPFSFFRYIFWNEEIDIRSEAGKQILQHELTHVQQKHSFDKLLIQFILIGGWFNPFFWLLRKEMDMIHEFIADKKAVNNGDTAALAQMLLTAAYPQQQFALTHPFFFSPIKRRLQMLTNNKNPRYSYIRRLVVLPLLAIVIVLFAFRSKERRENAEISVASVMENVAADQKQFFNSLLHGIGNLFENNKNDESKGFRSVFYNGRPLTVPTSFRLKDLGGMAVTNLDAYPLNLTPALSPGANDPLYVIDGKKITDKKSLDGLSPDDIQMIHIWKGADAIARYGDAGKDGVIEIVTKAFAGRKDGDGFSGLVYEGFAKDQMGNIVSNRVTYLKVTIFQGETDKTKVWEETHVVQSNESGAFTFTLGKDVKSSTKPEGEMEKLDWTQGPYFVNIAAAVAPSIQAGWWVPQDNYVDHGTTKMTSIPFPLVPKGYAPYKVTWGVRGKDVTIPANSTAVVTVEYAEAKKGDQVYARPNEVKPFNWSVYSATVEEDGAIKVRLANFTDKPITVSGDSYTMGLGKFNGPPAPNWTPAYLADVLFVVDGIVANKEALNILNQNDISSITVLKETRAVEKYGPAGKNGVVEILTKSRDFPARLKEASEKNTENVRTDNPPSIAVSSSALDPLGNPAKLRKVLVKDIIYQGSATSGVKVWEETQEVMSNDAGIFTIFIGRGVKASSIAAADLGKIDWSKGPFFINYKVAVYPSVPASWWVPADNLVDVGTTQLLSVPYGVYNKNNGAANVPNMRTTMPTVAPGLSFRSIPGTDVTIQPNTTAVVDVSYPGVKKGDPLLVTPADDYTTWTIYSAWVAADNAIKIRLANHTDKVVKVSGSDYKISVLSEKLTASGTLRADNSPIVVTGKKIEPTGNQSNNEVTVVGHPTRNPAGASSKGTLKSMSVPMTGTVNGAVFSGTLTSGSQYYTGIIPAEFPGGLSEWTKYLERNLDKDVPRKKGAPPGRYTVVLLLDIAEDGTISNVQAQNDPGYGTKEEAVNLILKSPKWTPALKDGKRTAYTHKQSISFNVQDPNANNFKPTQGNLNLASVKGKDITIPANTTIITTVDVPGAKKGNPVLATPQDDYTDWSIYSAWISDENKVSVRFANYTNKEVKVLASQYKIVVIKE